MKKIIKIGENQISLVSNAATSLRYKSTFGKDLLKEMAKLDKVEDIDKIDAVDMLQRLAYIMNLQAGGKAAEANETDFVNWLEQFEESDFQDTETIVEILAVWNKNVRTTSELKKEVSPQHEK